MTAVDTNILIRLLTEDDPGQCHKVKELFAGATRIYIPVTVLLETEWVLRYAYEFDGASIAQAFRHLLGLENVEMGHLQPVLDALGWHETGMDFADALHLALSVGQVPRIVTFDEAFVRRAPADAGCKVENLK